MFEFEKQKQLGLSQMCNSEDLDVSFAISFILCVQREKEDHRFAPKLHRAMPPSVYHSGGSPCLSPSTTAELSPKGLTQAVPGLESRPPPPCSRSQV